MDLYLSNKEAETSANNGFAKPDNITVGEAIEKEKAIMKREDEDLAKAREQIAQGTQPVSLSNSPFANTVAVTLQNVQSIRAEADKFSPDDQLVVTLLLQNKTSKKIKAVNGALNLVDPAGNSLKAAGVSYEGEVPPGKAVQWQAVTALQAADQKLLDTPVQQLKAQFVPQAIQYR